MSAEEVVDLRCAVWKYPLVTGTNILVMPYGAKPLTAQVQTGFLTLWAEVNPTAPAVNREFFVAMTGEGLPVAERTYIASVQQDWLVAHVFEVKR